MIDEVWVVGIEDFIFVILCGKDVFEDYFDCVFNFEVEFEVKGKIDFLDIFEWINMGFG